MNCQLCNGVLSPIQKADLEILECKKCNGFWIHAGELNKLIKHKHGDIEFSSIDHHMHKDTHGVMKCNYCNDQAMIKCNFIGYSDIILDYCEECGAFWIDNGEIEKMQKYIDKIEEQDEEKHPIAEIIMNILYSLPKI